MNEKRIEIYRSYTAVIALADIEVLAPDKDVLAISEPLCGVLVDAFHDSMVGFTCRAEEKRIYVTFKRLGDAEALVHDWNTVVDLLKLEIIGPQ